MGTPPAQPGELLADGETVFRAFSTKAYRQRNPPKVRPIAYYRSPDHEDGISLGRTPEAAVLGLSVNYGYCSVNVGAIHSLKYGLEVRSCVGELDHILLCKVPFLPGSDEERGEAAEIAGALARISKVETCDEFTPRKADELPPPFA